MNEQVSMRTWQMDVYVTIAILGALGLHIDEEIDWDRVERVALSLIPNSDDPATRQFVANTLGAVQEAALAYNDPSILDERDVS